MNQDMMNAAIVALMPFLVSLAITLFRSLAAKLPANRQAQAQQIVGVVVKAVEQMYKAAPGAPSAKKAEAVKLAQAMLGDLGVKVSLDTLNAMIEAAVHALPQAAQESPVQPGV